MDRRHPLTIYVFQSGLTWNDRYETSPSIPPTYPIWHGIVKVLKKSLKKVMHGAALHTPESEKRRAATDRFRAPLKFRRWGIRASRPANCSQEFEGAAEFALMSRSPVQVG